MDSQQKWFQQSMRSIRGLPCYMKPSATKLRMTWSYGSTCNSTAGSGHVTSKATRKAEKCHREEDRPWARKETLENIIKWLEKEETNEKQLDYGEENVRHDVTHMKARPK